MRLRPFFPFYGSKWYMAPKYPRPRFRNIYEPFCGSAQYSTFYCNLDIHLSDIDPVICGVWDFLIKSSERDISSLPSLVMDRRMLPRSIPKEASDLIGFWLNPASSYPKNIRTNWADPTGRVINRYWSDWVKNRIITQQKYIRHWEISNRSYSDCPNDEGCWFIDPPYNNEDGRHYVYNQIDYRHLAIWCKIRTGQMIVCDTPSATWMDFRPLAVGRSSKSSTRPTIGEGVCER